MGLGQAFITGAREPGNPACFGHRNHGFNRKRLFEEIPFPLNGFPLQAKDLTRIGFD